MTFRIPRLDVEQHNVDLIEFVIRQTFAKVTVGIERGMNSQRLRRREQPRGKTVLHQRFPTTQGKTAEHELQTVSILSQRFDRALECHRYPIHHVPRVRVVTVRTTKLTTRSPCNDPNTRPIDSRSRGERMQETQVAGSERRRYC